MSGKFLSKNDLYSAKKEVEILNSMANRGDEKAKEKLKHFTHVKCGCGADGCVFTAPLGKAPQ